MYDQKNKDLIGQQRQGLTIHSLTMTDLRFDLESVLTVDKLVDLGSKGLKSIRLQSIVLAWTCS